jgi:PhzF family phenazine biosynthesis protein
MRQWTIDAFTSRPFGGNAACVLEPMSAWPDVAWLQALAQENAVGATAFLLRTEDPTRFGLRWFTPAVEVPLCGHATLAAAHMLFAEAAAAVEVLTFETTASGPLQVRRLEGGYEMVLPAQAARPVPAPPRLAEALGAAPTEVWAGPYLVALFDTSSAVLELAPEFDLLRQISLELGGQGNVGVAALAVAGADHDVVDRFFAPGYGIPEDAATGSFHCILAPLFKSRLGLARVRFHQAFPGRGADLSAEVGDGRVRLQGAAVTIAESRLRGLAAGHSS